MNRSTLLLFDVDGTLTAARQQIDKEFELFLLREIRPKFTIGPLIFWFQIERLRNLKLFIYFNGRRIFN